jgi:hypothetical protein
MTRRSSIVSRSRLEKPVRAVHHFFMTDDVAALGGIHTALHAFDKLRSPFEHADNGFFHYLRGVLAFAGSKVL